MLTIYSPPFKAPILKAASYQLGLRHVTQIKHRFEGYPPLWPWACLTLGISMCVNFPSLIKKWQISNHWFILFPQGRKIISYGDLQPWGWEQGWPALTHLNLSSCCCVFSWFFVDLFFSYQIWCAIHPPSYYLSWKALCWANLIIFLGPQARTSFMPQPHLSVL